MQREEEKLSKEKSNAEDILLRSGFLYPVYTSYVSTGRSDQNWRSTFQDYDNAKANEVVLKYENEKWSIARISRNKVESKDNNVKIKESEIIPFSALVLVAISDEKANLGLLQIFDRDSQQKIMQCLIDFFSTQFSMKPSSQPDQRSVFDDPTDGTAKKLFKNAKEFFKLTQTTEDLPKPTFTFDKNKYLPGLEQSSTEESSKWGFWGSSSTKEEETKRPPVEEICQEESSGEEEIFGVEMGEIVKIGGSNNSNS